MKINKPESNWFLDASLLLGLLAAFWLDLTGLIFHQWLGVALGIGVGVHLLLHGSWVKSVTQRFFGRTSGQARLFYLIDAGLLLTLALTGLTGLVISTWFGLTLINYSLWKNLHIFSSIIALLVIVLKVGLHWRWIVKTARRSIFVPLAMRRQSHSPQLAWAPVNTGRRDFLRMMGVVGVAALVSIANGLDSDEQTVASASAKDQVNSSASDSTSDVASGTPANESSFSTSGSGSSLPASTTPCRVECNKRCSYPGHCRRYIDTNGNNRCDRGECI